VIFQSYRLLYYIIACPFCCHCGNLLISYHFQAGEIPCRGFTFKLSIWELLKWVKTKFPQDWAVVCMPAQTSLFMISVWTESVQGCTRSCLAHDKWRIETSTTSQHDHHSQNRLKGTIQSREPYRWCRPIIRYSQLVHKPYICIIKYQYLISRFILRWFTSSF